MLLLAHVHKLAPCIVASTHDISSWREHALKLAVLAACDLITSLRMHSRSSLVSKVVAGSCLGRTAASIAANTLPSGTEETFHTVEVTVGLGSLLCRLILAVVHLGVGTLVLKGAAIVTEASLRTVGSIRLKRLHLALESVIYALSLIDGVVQTFWACD